MFGRTWFYMVFLMAMIGVGVYVARQRWAGGEADVHYQQAYNLSKEGKHDEAITQLQRALGKDPKHELARGKLAEEFEAIGNYGGALKQWEQLLQITEEAETAGLGRARSAYRRYYIHEHIGICQLKMGQYTEAVDSFKTALETAAPTAELHRFMGEALVKTGQTRDAAREFLEAIKRKPQDTEAYRQLVKLYEDQGLPDKAREVGQRMKNLGGDLAKEWEQLRKRYGY